MIFTFLPLSVPPAGLSSPPDGACTVTVSVSPPLQAATTTASNAAAAVEMQSRLSDMPYLLLLFGRPSVTGLRPLEQDGAEDDRALGHLLNLGREVHLGHEAEDECEREDAEKRPDDARAAAGEARPADHDRADRVELVEVSAHRRGAAEARAQEHGRDARKQAR